MLRLGDPGLRARTTRISLPSAPSPELGPDLEAAECRAEVSMGEGKDAPTCEHKEAATEPSGLSFGYTMFGG